jgi:4-aminobutyrate aminotransferase
LIVISVTFQPGVYSIPYPFWHSSNLPPNTPAQTLTANSLYQLELLLAQQTAPSDTAAIIVEPVLGEGGYVPAPPEFLQGLRKVCDKHGIMLIVDEVQCGFGRTGSYFAIEESGVRPDILVIAKVFTCHSILFLLLTVVMIRALEMGFQSAV